MKNWKKTMMALILVVTMIIQNPLTVLAKENKAANTYISEIKVSESKEWLQKNGYTVVDNDLNKGTGKSDRFMGYKTTEDPDEAITDISVMDMKGGYSFSDYQDMLKKQKEEFRELAKTEEVLIEEFKKCYNAGSPLAKEVYDTLNLYIEDDSNKLMGDFFLDDATTQNDILDLCMQVSQVTLSNINQALTMATTPKSKNSWLDELSKIDFDDFDYDDDRYFDKAEQVMDMFVALQTDLQKWSDRVKKHGDDIEALEEADRPTYAVQLSYYKILSQVNYDGGTLYDYLLDNEIETYGLYPIISVLNDTQIAAIRLSGLGMLITCPNYTDKTADTIQGAMQEGAEQGMETYVVAVSGYEKENALSIYTGVDRSMYQDGVAVTSAARREIAATGNTDPLAGQYNRKTTLTVLLALSGLCVVASLTLTLAGGLAVYMYGGVSSLSLGTCLGGAMIGQVAGGFSTLAVVTAAAFYITLIVFVVVAIIMIHDALNDDIELTEIPKVLLDLKTEDDLDNYVRYDAVLDEKGNAADLNSFEGHQWNAMYTTKDKNAGDPITTDIVYQYNDKNMPNGYSPVHYFGEKSPFNLNSHVISDSAKPIYLFVKRSNMSAVPVTGSVIADGKVVVIASISGIFIGFVAAAVILGNTKKRKMPNSL